MRQGWGGCAVQHNGVVVQHACSRRRNERRGKLLIFNVAQPVKKIMYFITVDIYYNRFGHIKSVRIWVTRYCPIWQRPHHAHWRRMYKYMFVWFVCGVSVCESQIKLMLAFGRILLHHSIEQKIIYVPLLFQPKCLVDIFVWCRA